MATPNYNDPRAGTNAFSIGQQELLRLKNRIGFIEEAFEKLDDDPTDAIPTKLSELQNDVGFITADDIPEGSGGTVPTKTSDLTNDSGFITEDDLPTIPTKTSDLTNDSDYITSDYVDAIKSKLNVTSGKTNLLMALLEATGENLLDMSDSTVRSGGFYASGGDGQVPTWSELSTFSQSNIMPGVKGERIYFRRNGVSEWTALTIAFFDADFNPISSIASISGAEYITIPDNDDIAYFSVPINMSYVNSTVISKSPISVNLPSGGAADSVPLLQSWKGDNSSTYGEEYTVKARWNGDILKFECYGDDTYYPIQCDKVPWSGVTDAPAFLTESQVRAIVSEMMG